MHPYKKNHTKHKYRPNTLPYIAGHEFGHYVNGDNGICYYTPSSTLQAEAQADNYSVNLMYEIAEEQGFTSQIPLNSLMHFQSHQID
ncbi:hypothetical protein GYK47_03290 [Lactobacillus iners]|nr:hypothetical protein GYK47_03290 [Lactobacillus iners]